VNVRQRILDHARHTHLPDGTLIYLRPLREIDFDHAEDYFDGLSARSRYLRFMTPTKALSESTLHALRKAMNSKASAVTVALVDHGPPRGEERIGGVRIVPTRSRGTCEFAMSIVDAWQGRGAGTALMKEVMHLARNYRYHRVEGRVLATNTRMLSIARHARFSVRLDRMDVGVAIVSRAIYRA
jgi:GNAT superfamily N-acetyltransferase